MDTLGIEPLFCKAAALFYVESLIIVNITKIFICWSSKPVKLYSLYTL